VQTESTRRETEPGRRARTCVGCRAPISDDAGAIRVVLGLAGDGGRHDVAVDLAGGSFGRGARVHATPACLHKACHGGFARTWKREIAKDPTSLARDIVAATARRVEGLLLGARRAGHLAFGEEARRAVGAGAPLTVVARDAGEGATGGPVRYAVAEGRAVAWSTKAGLGLLFSRDEVALVAIVHDAVAREILRAIRLAESVREIDEVS
jgi:predicted RNA-binding protein YlxR (DUF448 family)